MADPSQPFALNILGVTDLVQNRTNKVDGGGFPSDEGVQGQRRDALELDMDDEELLKLRDRWEMDYATMGSKMEKVFTKNLESYLGKQANGQWLYNNDLPIAANLQFEAEETFLSAALAKNPEPVVWADNTPKGNAIASDVKTMLQFHADQLVIRRKLGLMVRQWSIFHLGVLKFGWRNFNTVDGSSKGDITVENRKIKDFVFDPDGYVDAYGDFTSYLGEHVTVTAQKLIEMFPEKEADILKEVLLQVGDGGKEVGTNYLGTRCTYTEWWTDEFTFTTFKRTVLAKNKNPNFNYPEEETDMQGGEVLDATGEVAMSTPRNHFGEPKKPYVFLSVYSLQEMPHDMTGNIEQNIPNQNLIAKRTEQIDYNISRANNSDAFSQNNFNEETAKQASTALRKGNPVLVPSGGPISEAIVRLKAEGLPDAVFNELETNKQNLRTSWGIQGISAQEPDDDQTARGMILEQSQDTSRIGGGIGAAIEQVADNVFNWMVQLYYVYYDVEHFAAILGNAKAVEYVQLSAAMLDRQVIVSVSPDSMKPKDDITNINLAQALYDKGAIGPKTLLKMVDFPNPDEAAADGALWLTDKLAYIRINFPEMFAQLQGAQVEMANSMLPPGGGMAPEQTTEPSSDSTAQDPASAALGQVDMPQLSPIQV